MQITQPIVAPSTAIQPLNSYLARTKALAMDALRSSAEVHVVMGNESCDLDSICSAVAQTILLQERYGVVLPLLNIPRQDLLLRRDAQHLLEMVGIDQEALLFVNEVPIDRLAIEGRLRLHLVDHNALAPHQAHLHPWIVGIVDHHFDEEKFEPVRPGEYKVMAAVGSCTTLVAQRLLLQYAATMGIDWATWLMAPILLDTGNLTELCKTSKFDREVAAALLPLVPSDLYLQLVQKRRDVDGLSIEELLRKDLKAYQEGELVYSISSLPLGVHFGREVNTNVLKALDHVGQTKSATIAMAWERSSDKRRLHVHCSTELIKKLERHFAATEELARTAWLERSGPKIATWVFPGHISRKHLQPMLRLSELQ